MTRMLRIRVEWGWSTIPDDDDLYPLPQDWDEMTPEQREAEINEYIETTVYNRIGTSGTVVEVDEHGNVVEKD